MAIRVVEDKHKEESAFFKVEENQKIAEPVSLYCMSFGFDMPIERSAYKESKTNALRLDEVENNTNSILYGLDNCMYGELLIYDLSKSLHLEDNHGMKPGYFDLDADNYTVSWSMHRKDNDNSVYTRSFVSCEHTFDLHDLDSKELKDTPIRFYVSIADESKEECFKEISDIYEKIQKYAENTLKNPKDLVFDKGIEAKFKKARAEISVEKANQNQKENGTKETKHTLKPKRDNIIKLNDFEK